MNHAWIQHLSQVCTDFFHQWQRNLPESFLKWGIISDLNHVFHQMSAAKLTGCCGTQQGVNKQNLPALVAKIPSCSSLNFSNSFSCLCSVVIFGVWIPWASSNVSIMPGYICGSGTQLAAITLATGIFFLNSEHVLTQHSNQYKVSCLRLFSDLMKCSVEHES